MASTSAQPAPTSSRVREPKIPSTYLYRSHFCIYGPVVQMELLDIQSGWISKLPPILTWNGTELTMILAWSGMVVSVQPYVSVDKMYLF
ncbi:hypothetical protein AVEN_98626-1 [Araneus ventricosus]|uniref:Uncharacterized protein n=1 Tax=Araneus ventricosus TaxID=182803 RepID=A0A4Y2IJV4_ARAVE|nr:hypothetical protein AVEN_98626-1 [Araneus ventricosus]